MQRAEEERKKNREHCFRHISLVGAQHISQFILSIIKCTHKYSMVGGGEIEKKIEIMQRKKRRSHLGG